LGLANTLFTLIKSFTNRLSLEIGIDMRVVHEMALFRLSHPQLISSTISMKKKFLNY